MSKEITSLSRKHQTTVNQILPLLISSISQSRRSIPDLIIGNPFKLVTEEMGTLEMSRRIRDNLLICCCLLLSYDLNILSNDEVFQILFKTVFIYSDLVESEGKKKYKKQYTRLLANSYAGLANISIKKFNVSVSDSIRKGASNAQPF